MQYVRLGSTGLKVSRICLGTMSFGDTSQWTLGVEQARPIVNRALDLGINFFDTANVYSGGKSEEITGGLLKNVRNDVVIATKVHGSTGSGPNDAGLSRAHVLREARRSLERLQTDRIDLYQTHRWDYETPIGETLVAMNDLVRSGKVTYVGASSMFAWQFAKALFTSDMLGIARFVSMQNHYNLCYREEEREMMPLCRDQGVALVSFSPLARGFLSGRYTRDGDPHGPRYDSDKLLAERYFRAEDYDVLERTEAVAKEKGVKPSQVALAWLLHKGVTAPIIGATKVEHVEDAVASIELKLSDDEVKSLEERYKPHPILEHD